MQTIFFKSSFTTKKESLPNEDTFLAKLNRHFVLTYCGIFTFFVVFAFTSNWSILLGENLMKWDIWDAEYPSQVLMSDALANGIIPMWNPLMQYGTPNYSVIGTPIWYPITLLLALFGYTPITIALSYAIHIAIGAFGMFFLALEDMRNQDRSFSSSSLCTSIVLGLLYGGCGVFLSNAEHIMIIISAAWIPFVFYFIRRFIHDRIPVFLLSSGACAGLIFIGGYPELFYNLFLFLAPYILYFSFKERKNFFDATKNYIFLCISTIMASAITILPFLKNMKLITRGTGLGQIPIATPLSALLSFLFPKTNYFITGLEPSMSNFYMGIIVLLIFPGIFAIKGAHKKLYLSMSIGAFLLCFGGNSFLHALFYRFLPMYSSFRFASLNRVFFVMFLLLTVAMVLKEIMESQISSSIVFFTKITFLFTGLSGILVLLFTTFFCNRSTSDFGANFVFINSSLNTSCIIAFYLIIFLAISTKKVQPKIIKFLITGMVFIELFTFSFTETPNTIAQFEPLAYSYNQAVRDYINQEFLNNANRNRNINFAGNARTTSGLNSKSIVFNKTFDEDGYVSFLLQNVSDFKKTYCRSIIEQNPIIYFTNNIMTPADITYEEWSMSCDIPPEQIFTELPFDTKNNEWTQNFNPTVTSQELLPFTKQNDSILIEGFLNATSSATGRIRLFFENNGLDFVTLNLTFIELDNIQHYNGTFEIQEYNNERYIDIFFPDITRNYQQLQIYSSTELPIKAKLVVTERITSDPCVNVSKFGFNNIEMSLNAPTEGLLTILQAKHDGWIAYVDGKKAQIASVNNCFMGLHLDKGEHTVILKFRPKEFFIGTIISIGYLLSLLIMFLQYNLTKKNILKSLKRS